VIESFTTSEHDEWTHREARRRFNSPDAQGQERGDVR
jgi:hypothetical protein